MENTPPTPSDTTEKHVLFQVTSLSKALALIIFIVMPFVGGYIGYTYSPVKIVEVEKIVVNTVDLKKDIPEQAEESLFIMAKSGEKIQSTRLSPDVDYQTLEVISGRVNEHYDGYLPFYSKDENNVYFESEKIIGADPNTFELLGTSTYPYQPHYFSQDTNNVYFLGKVIPVLDLNSFTPLQERYSKDAVQVYYENEVVMGADPLTFEEITSGGCFYGRDKNYVFSGTTTDIYKDPKTFDVSRSICDL